MIADTEPHLKLDETAALQDYQLAAESRQVSLIGRREVMSGRAKFGIFGDGKELAQIALAKVIRPGDFRAGYYRDQTLALALGVLTHEQFFAGLYAHADPAADPMTAGRSMPGHYTSRSLDAAGAWRNLAGQINFSADVSPTAAQMPRLVGLGYASRLYRELAELRGLTQFSRQGQEIAFGTIGNASTAEGLFWESINAIGVLQAPVLLSVWDDGYGISVPNEQQLLKADLSALLRGFQRAPGSRAGFELYTVRGWDYPALLETYARAAATVRAEQVPAIVHVVELTQPQGHSTSGSHERYKPRERLAWEQEYDCLRQFRAWCLAEGLATPAELDLMERDARQTAERARGRAWAAFHDPIRAEQKEVAGLLDQVLPVASRPDELRRIQERLAAAAPLRREAQTAVSAALRALRHDPAPVRQALVQWKTRHAEAQRQRYGSHLYSSGADSALAVPEVQPRYSKRSPELQGFEILNAAFDALLARDPRVLAFGEDVGRLGDVNQGFSGLQAKYGELRVADTGIREATIVGQAIGLALRGLRPIAEIQYLDYLLYALEILSDDLACLRWRSAGGQKAPVIIRTRGHRLEGIWHSGSPMAAAVDLLRGLHVLVPRNMTQAAGFYNTLLKAEEPALVVEVLNGYRLKERRPDNLAEFTLPLGVPEVIRPGTDLTVATYGACCRIALEAAGELAQAGIEVEVIDVRSLLPFDRPGLIGRSLQKTSRILFLDEDMPGGTTAYMLQAVLEDQGGFRWLDAPPRTLAAQPHRPAYGSDGDYWSKPNAEQVFEAVYDLMHEADPARYPMFYR